MTTEEREPYFFKTEIRRADHYAVRTADEGAKPLIIESYEGKTRVRPTARRERVYSYEGALKLAGKMIQGLHRRTPEYLRACIIELRQPDGSWVDTYWAAGPLNRYGLPTNVTMIGEEE